MRKNSMFSQLLAGFLAVILLCVGVLFALSFHHLRSSRINASLEALTAQAKEMAYLAGQLPAAGALRNRDQTAATERLMYWKADQVYREYNAYIIVYDHVGGGQRTYYNETTLQDESMKHTPTPREYEQYLQRVVRGQDIIVQTDSVSGPLFTVIVPITTPGFRNESSGVSGLVLIQTAAQTIRASYVDLVWQVAVAAIALSLAAVIAALIFTRRITKPIIAMEKAANSMAGGDFTARAPEKGTREILSLSASFNQMADKLATQEQSRRDFVANVSHELRSPITSIQGFAQGLLDGTIPEEEQAKYHHIIADETHRLSKLIHALLSLSRMENDQISLNFTDFDINERIRLAIIARLNELENKELELETDFVCDPCPVHADCDQVYQVLINLLDNAIKFTPKGGSIHFTTREENSLVFLRIQDSGQGILPEDAPHIFDRFYKADKAHTTGKGTGLGLAICKRIMEKHGQVIRLLPCEQGATFEISLEKAKEKGGSHGDTGTGKD